MESQGSGNKDLAAALQAIRDKKLSIRWEGPRPQELNDDRLLPPLWTALRRRWPKPPGTSQDEKVTLRLIGSSDKAVRLHLTAVFDHDFCSQYDRTEEHQEEICL